MNSISFYMNYMDLYAFLYKCLGVYTQVDDGNEHTHIPPRSWCHLKSHAPHTDRLTGE